MLTLDVIIVNWNTGTQLLDCLKSLQTTVRKSVFQLSGCFVIDNASTDGSAEISENYAFPLTIIRNQENKGFAYACNQGAKAGNAEFILFLNPDVVLFQDSLTNALLFLSNPEHAKVGLLGIQLVDEKGVVQRNVARFPTPKSLFYQMFGLDRIWPGRFPAHFMTDWNHQDSREVDQVQGSFFLVRRKVFEELQGFDERFFMYYEDLDFAFRATRAGWKVYYLADTQSFHRGGGTSHQVKAKRLFYVLCSRTKYVAKHFPSATMQLTYASLLIEFPVRVVWGLVNFSGTAVVEAVQAYWMFLRELPHLTKEIRRSTTKQA